MHRQCYFPRISSGKVISPVGGELSLSVAIRIQTVGNFIEDKQFSVRVPIILTY